MVSSLCVKESGGLHPALHAFLDLLLTSLSFNFFIYETGTWDKGEKIGEELLREVLGFIPLFMVSCGPWGVRGFIPSLIYSINIW